MKILYVTPIKCEPYVVCVELNKSIYYIIIDTPGAVYLSKTQLHINDINNWLIKETQTKYNYRDLLNMSENFRYGYDSAIINSQQYEWLQESLQNIINKIFRTNIISHFKNTYSIELLDHDKFLDIIDRLRTHTINSPTISNIIARLLKYAELHSQESISFIEKLAQKYNCKLTNPKYENDLHDIIIKLLDDEIHDIDTNHIKCDADDLLKRYIKSV
jgi:hypothetical protein